MDTVKPKLNYKQCGLSDLDLLVETGRSTFYDTFAKDNEAQNLRKYIDTAFSAESIKRQLLDPGSAFYFAYHSHELVGYLKVNYSPSQTDVNDPRSIELERVYVIKKFQSKGYGKQMLEEALEIGRSRNLNYMWLGVWERNAGAIRFYERNGFTRFDEHSFYMGDELQTDYLMKLTL